MAAQEQHIQNIREKAAYDAEELEAPKSYWPLDMSDELDEWYKDREKLKKTNKVLDAY